MDLATLRRLVAGDERTRVAGPFEVRSSWALVVVATLWMVAVVSWEIAGPILGGHYASAASMGIIAENMHRWGIVAPVWSYTAEPPEPALYYCHHPFGIFWSTSLFYELFGRHDIVCRLPAALLSIATPPLLFALARDLYRPIAGACAAVAFVVLPISLSFASFNALEVPVIAYGTLFLWAWVRARRTGSRRWTATMVAAAMLAMNADWPAFVLVLSVLAIEAVVFVRARGKLPRQRLLGWAALAGAGLVIGLGYLFAFAHWDRLDDLFASYSLRSHTSERSIFTKLDARSYWIDLMFTPVAIALGKVGVLVVLARAWSVRSVEELAPLCLLAMALFQYLAFPQGADIHVFWPHHFAPYFALAVAALVATLLPSAVLLWGNVRGRAIAATIVLVPLALILRDGVETLVWARRTGGRFNEKGMFIQSDGDKVAALKVVAADLPPSARVALHSSMAPSWAHVWALGGRVVDFTSTSSDDLLSPYDVWIADLRYLRETEAAKLLSGWEVRAYGPYLVGRQGFGFRAFAMQPREPSAMEWWLVSGTEPIWTIEEDAFAAWEIAEHHGMDPDPPTGTPSGLEQQRIAHNHALATGDERRAETLRSAILSAIDPATVELEGGHRILGTRVDDGVQPRATVFFVAGGPLRVGVFPRIRSRVVRRAPLSTTPADPTRRDVAARPLISPALWRRGFIYALTTPLLPRPGVEAFELGFSGVGAPRPLGAAPVVPLFEH